MLEMQLIGHIHSILKVEVIRYPADCVVSIDEAGILKVWNVSRELGKNLCASFQFQLIHILCVILYSKGVWVLWCKVSLPRRARLASRSSAFQSPLEEVPYKRCTYSARHVIFYD